jgi:hypothetical protein
MCNIYALLTNVITTQEIRDCGLKYFCSLHSGPLLLSNCAGLLQRKGKLKTVIRAIGPIAYIAKHKDGGVEAGEVEHEN